MKKKFGFEWTYCSNSDYGTFKISVQIGKTISINILNLIGDIIRFKNNSESQELIKTRLMEQIEKINEDIRN